MGTRGAYGVRVDGVDKLMYNHWDSYPEELGVKVMKDILAIVEEHGAHGLAWLAREAVVYDLDSTPSPEDYDRLGAYQSSGSVGGPGDKWYQLTHGLQGNLKEGLSVAFGGFEQYNDFIRESLFCEWAYILDIREDQAPTLEVWRGFQTEPDPDNPYGQVVSTEVAERQYYPCKLVLRIPLSRLQALSEKEFVREAYAAAGAEPIA